MLLAQGPHLECRVPGAVVLKFGCIVATPGETDEGGAQHGLIKSEAPGVGLRHWGQGL